MSAVALDLTAEQFAELEASAIKSEVAQAAGLYAVHDAKAAAKLLGRGERAWRGHVPALVYPYYYPLQRDPVVVRGKPCKPFEIRKPDGSVRLAKYVQPRATGTHIYFGPSLLSGNALRDTSIPLIATEGEKKCLSAESHGFACIAIPGVSQWHAKGTKELHPYFSEVALEGRLVILAFDADALMNEHVRREELAFGRALERKGARVRILRFTADAPKLDDYLATHELSEFHQLIADAEEHGHLPPDTRAPSEEWESVLPRLRCDDRSGLPIKDVDSIAHILMWHPAWEGVLAYDARRERQSILKDPPWPEEFAVEGATVPRALADDDASRIGVWLVSQPCLGWKTAPTVSQLEQAMSLVCKSARYDEVSADLDRQKWDGTPRLDGMASTYFGAEDTPYTRAVTSKWMLSAVARVRKPGCQADHVLVLEGPQGIGKSSALRVLAGDAHFADTLPPIPSRDALEYCVGPWIIELAELDHLKKAEMNAIKAFISTRTPSFRGAYGRRTTEHPRRCVFAGTTNHAEYLNDSTGNRRFWPIVCGRIDLEALARDRGQLWAEADARLAAGESWHITDAHVRAEVEERQAQREVEDPWQARIRDWLKNPTAGAPGMFAGRRPLDPEQGVTSADVMEHALGLPASQMTRGAATRVGIILRPFGWLPRQVREGSARVRRYFPCHDLTDEAEGSDKGRDIGGPSKTSPVTTVTTVTTTIESNYSKEGKTAEEPVAAGYVHTCRTASEILPAAVPDVVTVVPGEQPRDNTKQNGSTTSVTTSIPTLGQTEVVTNGAPKGAPADLDRDVTTALEPAEVRELLGMPITDAIGLPIPFSVYFRRGGAVWVATSSRTVYEGAGRGAGAFLLREMASMGRAVALDRLTPKSFDELTATKQRFPKRVLGDLEVVGAPVRDGDLCPVTFGELLAAAGAELVRVDVHAPAAADRRGDA